MVDAAYDKLYEFLRPGVRENETRRAWSPRRSTTSGRSTSRASTRSPASAAHRTRTSTPTGSSAPATRRSSTSCTATTATAPATTAPSRSGRPAAAQNDAYIRAREYMDRAIALVRPGATTADIVKVWPTAQEFGFPDEEAAFALQYGHGVGLSIWEKPIFSRLVSLDHPEVLKEGMFFALETYWPSADGIGAARIEEEVVVTATGCEVVTKFPAEELLVAGQRYFSVGGQLPVLRSSAVPPEHRRRAGASDAAGPVMRASVYHGAHDVRIEDVARARAAPGRGAAAGVCAAACAAPTPRSGPAGRRLSRCERRHPVTWTRRADDSRARVRRRGGRDRPAAGGSGWATSSPPAPGCRAVSATAVARDAPTSAGATTRSASTPPAGWPSTSRCPNGSSCRSPKRTLRSTGPAWPSRWPSGCTRPHGPGPRR